jgi:hypothetical protein
MNCTVKTVNHFVKAKLEQPVIMTFLWRERTDPVEIHCRLLRAFQRDADTLLSVYEPIRAFKTGRINLLDEAPARGLNSII